MQGALFQQPYGSSTSKIHSGLQHFRRGGSRVKFAVFEFNWAADRYLLAPNRCERQCMCWCQLICSLTSADCPGGRDAGRPVCDRTSVRVSTWKRGNALFVTAACRCLSDRMVRRFGNVMANCCVCDRLQGHTEYVVFGTSRGVEYVVCPACYANLGADDEGIDFFWTFVERTTFTNGGDRTYAPPQRPNVPRPPWSSRQWDPETNILMPNGVPTLNPDHVSGASHPVTDELVDITSGPDRHTLQCAAAR